MNEDEIIQEWQNKFLEIDTNHLCNSECTEDKLNLVTIDRDYSLFGCRKSGRIHKCDGNETCDLTTINEDGEMICMFSGYIVGKYIDKQDRRSDAQRIPLGSFGHINSIHDSDQIHNYQDSEKKPRKNAKTGKVDRKKVKEINKEIKKNTNQSSMIEFKLLKELQSYCFGRMKKGIKLTKSSQLNLRRTLESF